MHFFDAIFDVVRAAKIASTSIAVTLSKLSRPEMPSIDKQLTTLHALL
jgi:hypothetical protein